MTGLQFKIFLKYNSLITGTTNTNGQKTYACMRIFIIIIIIYFISLYYWSKMHVLVKATVKYVT